MNPHWLQSCSRCLVRVLLIQTHQETLPVLVHQQAYNKVGILQEVHHAQHDHFPEDERCCLIHSTYCFEGNNCNIGETNLVICLHRFAQTMMNDEPDYKQLEHMSIISIDTRVITG